MRIREAEQGDNVELQRLQARCPMGTNLIVQMVNTPDFFARAKVYENFKVYVACEGDRIMGSAACAVRDAIVNGELRRVGYEFQAFTSPEHRRKGVAVQLHKRREAYIREQGGVLAYTLIMEGNIPAMRYIERQGFERHRTLVMAGLAAFRETDASADGQIRPAERKDLAALADLLNETWGGYELYGPATEEGLERAIERTPAYSIDSIFVLEHDGQILACMGCWDWTQVTELTVLGLSRKMKMANWLVNGARLFRPMPRTLRPGDRLTQMVLTPIAYKDPQDLTPLFAHLNNVALSRRVEIMFCMCERDAPILRGIKGFIRVDTAMHLYTKPLQQRISLGHGPVFVEGVDL